VAEEFDGTDSDLIEITPGANSTYNQTVITSGVFSATASPDQTRLLYTTRDGIFLRDLSKGTVKKLAPGADGGNYCLAWSPDSNRFSFRSSEGLRRAERAHLYVSDLDGKTKQIWETWNGAVNPSCDVHWIAPDRLIFDRFLGARSQNERAGEIVSENTTTVAILGDPVKFVDTDKTWSIDGVCQYGNAAVVRPQDKDDPVSIVKNLDDLKTLNPSQVCSHCLFVGFAAKSCVPFFLETDNKTSDLFSLNTINWQRQRAAHINRVFSVFADNIMISSSARLMVLGSFDSLFLVDTESGDVEPFFPRSFSEILSKRIISIKPIVWLEK
jgi:WD40 repeat protein